MARLESIYTRDLEALSAGLESCADGDLTQTVRTVTTPVEVDADESARAAQELATTAEDLERLVRQFKITV